MRYRIEAITLPVSDVGRAKAFYLKAGWNLDLDVDLGSGKRVVQFTPEGTGLITVGPDRAIRLWDVRPVQATVNRQ